MKPMKHAFTIGLCLGALAACDKPAETKTDDPTAKNTTTTTNATGAANTATTTPTPAPAPVVINDGDLSTPADFEETAEKAITAKTYKADLASIETELSKE
jgi:hypothetical protein